MSKVFVAVMIGADRALAGVLHRMRVPRAA